MSVSKKVKREMHFRSCDRAHEAFEPSRARDPFTEPTERVLMLLTDLMHMCQEQAINFDATLARARANYEQEKIA